MAASVGGLPGRVREGARLTRASGLAIALTRALRWTPGGLQSPIQPRGSNLSDGERQLIALARAALADPAILILDEATADIDTTTEKALTTALERIGNDRTLIIIAHRPTTAATVDRIIELRNGRITTDRQFQTGC